MHRLFYCISHDTNYISIDDFSSFYKFQLRHHPFSLYTVIMNNVRYGTIPSRRIFNILSDSLFSLGVVLTHY